MSRPLFGGTAAFRHGTSALEGGQGTKPTPSPAYSSLPTATVSAAQRAAQSFVTVLAPTAASDPAPEPHSEEVGSCRNYPTVPFYGLLNELEVAVETREGAAGVVAREVDACLRHTASTAGLVYYLGTQPAAQDPDMHLAAGSLTSSADAASSTTSVLGAATSLCLSYGTYVAALADVFAQLIQLRDGARTFGADQTPPRAPPRPPVMMPHTLHIRIGGHPRWKDLSAMIAVEQGRLLLYMSASSRLTQEFLTTRARQYAVELVWVAGATMVEEPKALTLAEVSPVFVAWDCLLSLPLLTPRVDGATNPVPSEAGQRVTAEAYDNLTGFYVAIVSSLPLAGAERHSLRFCLTKEVPTEHAAAPQPRKRTREKTPSRGLRQRLVWRLVPETGPRGLAVVTPFFFTHVVRCLVTLSHATPLGCRLPDGFDVRCSGDARASKSRLVGAQAWWRRRHGAAPPAAPDRAAAADVAMRPHGLTYMTARNGMAGGGGGGGRLFAPLQSISSQSWLGFSRLSCAAWVQAQERHLAGLEEDEECEFNLLGLRYHPRSVADANSAEASATVDAAPRHRRSRESDCQDSTADSEQCTPFVETTQWTSRFEWRVEVTRVMAYESSESGEDGGL